jgi:outer membrane protein OmpA-like peptidoglycan-associated protein
MKRSWCALFFFTMVFLASCANNRTLVVLLPDSDGTVGVINVTSNQGNMFIDEAFSAVRAIHDKEVKSVRMSKQAVEARFEKALAIEPAQRFRIEKLVFYCQINSTKLTPESTNLFSMMMDEVIMKPPEKIYVLGHTDRSGTKSHNMQLSRRRALAIVQELVAKGINPEIIMTIFLGESNPLIITAQNTPEPKNRRVELVLKYNKEN